MKEYWDALVKYLCNKWQLALSLSSARGSGCRVKNFQFFSKNGVKSFPGRYRRWTWSVLDGILFPSTISILAYIHNKAQHNMCISSAPTGLDQMTQFFKTFFSLTFSYLF